MDGKRKPWPGFFDGELPPVPKGATAALSLTNEPWLYRYDEQPFTVAAVILNQKREILAVSRKKDHEDLGLPGGKIDPGERAMEAIRREVFEETGLQITVVRPLYLSLADDGRPLPALAVYVPWWWGEPESKEGARTVWVPPARLLEINCSFRLYNARLFEHMRTMFPEMGWLP
jgi:8-oxo-dGTP pyrophosphatase MutT (NUDIX family)